MLAFKKDSCDKHVEILHFIPRFFIFDKTA